LREELKGLEMRRMEVLKVWEIEHGRVNGFEHGSWIIAVN
jgi:hypothetical protein